MTNNEIKQLIKQAYDLHYHGGPDVLPRKYNDLKNLITDQSGKIAGVAIKTHSFPVHTNLKNKLKIIGSITLNNFVGGINLDALYACKNINKDLPFIVWLPTMHAKNHIEKNYSPFEIPPEWIKDDKFIARKKSGLEQISFLDKQGKLKTTAKKLIDKIKEYHFILATGHTSSQEAEKIITYALKKKITTVITHPMQRDIAMPLNTQVKLTKIGAYIEYCYIMWLDRDRPEDYPLSEIAGNIKKIGADKCILSSDGGQVRNATPSQCLFEFVKNLSEYGITKKEFETMLIKNQKKILTN